MPAACKGKYQPGDVMLCNSCPGRQCLVQFLMADLVGALIPAGGVFLTGAGFLVGGGVLMISGILAGALGRAAGGSLATRGETRSGAGASSQYQTAMTPSFLSSE